MDIREVSVKDIHDDAVLLDVREQNEWDAGHAIEAVHIPLGELVDRIGEVPDEQPVHVICRSGKRSMQGAHILVDHDIDAVSVEGGMTAWYEAGKPMLSDNGQDPQIVAPQH